MNSLRPLATISLLGIVGLFLYMKINETEPVVPADVAEWGNFDQLGDIDIGAGGAIANVDIGGTSTDAMYGQPVDSVAIETPNAEQTAPFASVNAVMSDAASQAPPAFVPNVTEPVTSPAPVSGTADRYAAAPESTSHSTANPTTPEDSKLPPLPELPAAVAGAALGAVANEIANQNAPTVDTTTTGAPAVANAGDAASETVAPVTSAAPAPHVSTPADTSTTVATSSSFPTTEPVAPTESLEADKQMTAGQASLFSAARVAVQSALDRGELSQALLLLSDWYGDPSLSPGEATEVQELLSQLAGSVIYSTEHRLEPAYIVQSGEKLGDIAQKYNVPEQLLAKINGITSSDQLQAGQQLKVVRGPFSARIDLSERKLVLMLDRRYAGQFALDIDPSTSVEEGYWSVNQKLLTPGSVGMINPSASPAGEERSILLTSTSGNGQVTILRGPGVPTPGAADPPGRVIKLRGTDVEDVYDILSQGSQVVIRR